MTSEIDQLFGNLRRGPFVTAPSFDPGQTAYDSQPASIAPQGFIDELDTQFMTDFVLYGCYNPTFGATPALGLGTNIAAITNELPGWWGGVIQDSGSAVTASVVAATAPSGQVLQFALASGAAGDAGHVSQTVPIGGFRSLAGGDYVWGYVVADASNTGTFAATLKLQYVKADKVTTTGGSTTVSYAIAAGANEAPRLLAGTPPADAAFLKIDIGVKRDAAAISAIGTLAWSEVRVDHSHVFGLFADLKAPGTFPPVVVSQLNGVFSLSGINIDQTTGEVLVTPGNLRLDTGGAFYLPEISAPSTPASGRYVVYAKSDNHLYGKNDAGTESRLDASGSVATDAIFDAKGDLAVGTGADTAARLAVGADDTILMADSAATTGLKWVAPVAPVAVGTANAQGSSDDFARGSHVHAHEAAHINHDTTWAAKGDIIAATANDAAAVVSVGSDGQVLTADAASASGVKWAAAAGGSSDWTTITKSADESVTSNSTPQDDDELVVALSSGKSYLIELLLIYSNAAGGTPDLKVVLGEDSTARGVFEATGFAATDVAQVVSFLANQTATLISGTAASARGLFLKGIYTSAGGTFKLQWAQNSSNATATKVLAGSILRYKLIA